MSELAILGGKCIMPQDYPIPDNLFRWPIITKEDEEAVLDVVRRNAFSGFDVTEKFEEEVCQWLGVKHAVGFTNGTMSLEAAMYAVGLGAGDEMICPTKTYWASALSAGRLGASVVFANIHPDNLTLDPRDLERCLSPKTKAIMVVHYLAYPADMDAIMAFAKKHNLKVLEDCSHAQGGYYKGKRLGTIGDVAAMSMMKPPKKRMMVGSAKHAMIPWYSSRSPYSPSEPCMMLKAELDAPNSNTKMMTTEVAHAGMASVSHNITAITKMAMMRCCTTVRPSMPKQSIGRFHTKTVSRAVMRNMSPFLRLKSPVNAFFTVSFMFIVESLCFLWTSTMYF